MDMSPDWLTGLENGDHMSKLYSMVDTFSVDSFSSESYTENTCFIDRSFQTPTSIEEEAEMALLNYQNTCSIKKTCLNPKPLVTATSLPSSNTFTISFGDLKPKDKSLPFGDSLRCKASGASKVPTMARSSIQAQDHVLAERKRREKMNRHFISLCALLPKLKKTDKATVLEDASNYIKELQGRVKELEGLLGIKRKNIQESVISMKRSKLSGSDEEYSSSDETNSEESNAPCKSTPEVEVRMSGSSVLVRIQCPKNSSSLVKALTEMQKLGLSVVSSSAVPFSTALLFITIVAQIEGDFFMTTADLLKKLQLTI